MTTSDRPEDQLTVDERTTRELCGAERDGIRCVRPKGHANDHEAFRTAAPVKWNH